MKNFFRTSFIIFALIISVAGAAPAAHAQTGKTADGGSCFENSDCASNYCSPTERTCLENAAAKSGNIYDTPPPTIDPAAAGTQKPYNPGDAEDFFAPVMQQIMKLFAWLVGAAALTLDYSVYYTVVNMGNYVNDLAAVGVTWRILRDIGNIIIIFGFLGIGIAIILGVNWYGGGFKMLPLLLVSAVFLNFSLFLSEAVIDVGNLFATQIYTQIKGGQLPTAASLSGTTILDAIERDGISTKIMSQLGLTTVYGNATRNQQVFAAGNSLLIGFMGIILFLVTAFVLFSLAFVLISRFVILLFLIIIAPIGFAGLAVPQLKNTANKWWDTLFQQTITAPVLFLLLYIALAVITDVQFLTGLGIGKGRIDADWTGWVTSNNLAGFGGVMLSFLVAMGLLLAVVIFSKKLSAFGADWASKTAGKLTFGATAFGIRSTAGWGFQAASRRFSSSKLSRVPVIGRSIAGVFDRGAKGSFDVRGIKTLGGLKGGIGIDAGEAEKGGYRQWEKDKIKEREDYAATLTLNKDEKAEEAKEKGRKAMMEGMVKAIEEQNERDKNDLRGKHAVALESPDLRIDTARQKLNIAEAAHRASPTAATQMSLNNARTALDVELRDRERIAGDQKKEMDKLNEDQSKTLNAQKAEVEERQKAADAVTRRPQETYARRITWGPGKIFYRNEEAAKNIIKSAGRSKSEKDLDTLKTLLEKAAKDTGGGTPPPPVPPAGGGGGAAPHP